jgi:nucleotide-binding universal stress UspA family protein
MKTILVPADFSKEARQAFIYALEIAKLTKASIVLFHAFHQPIPVDNAFRLEETILALEKEKEKLLASWADEVRNELYQDFSWKFESTHGRKTGDHGALTRTTSGFHTIEKLPDPGKEVKVSCFCKFGIAAEEINPAAKKYQADLILMSSRGAGAIGQALMGSTVSAVISNCEVPVLTLPQHTEFKKLHTFVFASDLNLCTDKSVLENLRTIIKAFGAELKVLHLYQENDLPTEQKRVLLGLDTLDLALYDLNYQVYFKQSDDIVTGIYDFVQQQKADLLVLVHKRHQFLEILLKKSVTGIITRQGFVPFITLPYPR